LESDWLRSESLAAAQSSNRRPEYCSLGNNTVDFLNDPYRIQKKTSHSAQH
jgi:hypothetical protein